MSQNIEFMDALKQSLSDQSFARITLNGYIGVEKDLKKVSVKRILVKREEKLSFTYSYKTRDIVKNYDIADGIAKINALLPHEFKMATLLTTEFDLVLDKKLTRMPPSHTKAPSLHHDRQKNHLISPEGKSYLRDLKITDEKGNVYKNAQGKFRQINKYIEILSGLLKDIPARKVVDMGSGKGYLTFALYDYLGGDVEVVGVEYRDDMVKLCNDIARKSQFKKLKFVQGTIDKFDTDGANVLIALHACDTATDDAIYKGIASDADLIVVAPCCHKQIRREMEHAKAPNDVSFLTQHGIFLERQAEMITDGLRALLLEYAGYSTKVFEFISDAHTPKNVMIVGTKNPRTKKHDPAILAKINDIKVKFGITQHHLEKMMKL